MLPTPSADLMIEPCKASDAGKNSDEDLQSDLENMECMADLRLQVYRLQAYVTEITKHTK